MLPVKLHSVIGRTHIADSCNKTPDEALPYNTIPIRSPTERYSGINIILIKILVDIDLLILFEISS